MSASVDFGLGITNPRTWIPTLLRFGKAALGFSTPEMQIVVNIVLIVLFVLSSSVGFLAGVPLALAALALAGIGLLRLVLSWVL